MSPWPVPRPCPVAAAAAANTGEGAPCRSRRAALPTDEVMSPRPMPPSSSHPLSRARCSLSVCAMGAHSSATMAAWTSSPLGTRRMPPDQAPIWFVPVASGQDTVTLAVPVQFPLDPTSASPDDVDPEHLPTVFHASM
ncbi:hypothetical protein ZWY2020_011173 [Hordeum vulgare]|nr:hypothetical protein ZWY2020_011173 [Hordeum vulgare]